MVQDGQNGKTARSMHQEADDLNVCVHSFWLIASIVSFGLITNWAAGFVAQEAVILRDGSSNTQPVYNSGLTFLAAVLCLAAAIPISFTATQTYRSHTRRVMAMTTSGMFLGMVSTLAYIVGNTGAESHSIELSHITIIIAGAIEMLTFAVAFMAAFAVQVEWVHPIVWRMVCAFTVAAASVGSRCEALLGTRFRSHDINQEPTLSRSSAVSITCILVSAMTNGFCIS